MFQYAARHNPIAISDLVDAIEATDGDGDVGMGGGDGGRNASRDSEVMADTL